MMSPPSYHNDSSHMKIYLAARYSRLKELNLYAADLRDLGHTVDCRWLLGAHQAHDGALEIDAIQGDTPLIARLFAEDDVSDLKAADMIVSFTEAPRSNNSRGGRHVEFGMALALGKKMVVVGPRENVFHTLPAVRQFPDWPAAWAFFKMAALHE